MAKTHYTPLVIGLGTNGLGVVRSLARHNIQTRVLVSEKESREVYFNSRHGQKEVMTPLTGREVMDFLNREQAPLLLMPVLEELVLYLSCHRQEVPKRHCLLLPSHEIMELLLNKEKFAHFAKDQNLTLPGSWTINAREQLSDILAVARPPFILKPILKRYIPGLQKATIVASEAELFTECAAILDKIPELIIQEFIPGGDDQIYFCLQHINQQGELMASFVGRKIRQWPPLSGGTASCEPAHVPELHQMTSKIFAKAGFCGTGSMEYKLDPRNQHFMIIEPTAGRTDFQEYVATANGVNIPYMAYCEANNIVPPPCIQTEGKRAWMHFINDRLAQERGNQNLTTLQWLWSLRRVRAFDFLSLSDPGPLFHYVKNVFSNRLGVKQ